MKTWTYSLALASAALLLSASTQAQVSYIDRAADFDIGNEGFGRGAAMIDLDGDGLLDLIASNAGMPSAYFRQLEGGGFEEISEAWGIAPDDRASWGVLVADFDNDGDRDIYHMNGAFFGAERNQVLRNDLNTLGRFTDVSEASGDGALIGSTFGGSAVDYDRDGDLDIFLANTDDDGLGMGGNREAYPVERPLLEGGNLNLLRNDGNLVFTEVTAEAGVIFSGHFKHTGVGDIDNDGWPDLGVGNFAGDNAVFRNNGDGTFQEVAGQLGVTSPRWNFGMVFDDFNNDGWMDIYLPKYQENPEGPSELYLNQGGGQFVNATPGSGLTGQTDMGHNVSDADGDGYPDIYIGTGNPDFEAPDKLFLITPTSLGGILATDASVGSGILERGPTRSHGHAFGDYDNDGDIDIWVNNGGPQRILQTREKNFLWENEGTDNNWLMLDLRGVLSNESAVGARVRAVTNDSRDVYRHVAVGKGFGNTNDLAVHVGIGQATFVQRAEITWPSGISQTVLGPAIGERHEVIETGMTGAATATAGDTYIVSTYGPANHEVSVMRSSAPAEIPLPKFGGIGRLAQPVTVLKTGTMDASGRGSVPITVPDGVPGEQIYLQAWIHEPGATEGGALSNLIVVTLE